MFVYHCLFYTLNPNKIYNTGKFEKFTTPSPPLFTFTPTHDLCPQTHSHSYVLFYSFMLNLLFAYPINLINTNVGPITHPYYNQVRDVNVWNCWWKNVLSQRDQTKWRPSSVLPKRQRRDNVFYLMCTNYYRWLRVPYTVRCFRSQCVRHTV